MPDIIQLLPDNVANQIAAGEVIQRPASVVKELLENSIDAGATNIQLIIKDAGKTLIQVVDNGCGMSETDARMSFERHATSKLKKAEDLFAIKTKGFRGEAMPSIAAIAQVELKTALTGNELGSKIVIEGAQIKIQEPCSHPAGSSISVKNLFFNIPARRKFLKSNPVETKHIIDEFIRVALAHSDIEFSFTSNDSQMYALRSGNLRQRIVNIFGNNYNDRLVPAGEETDIIKISGFIGKPEFAKKTRGEQFFFVNNRFIKDPYLFHAVNGAFDDLIPSKSYPLYIIFMDVDPKNIDINIHPTKQEIKFDDERLMYSLIKSAVKHALGKYSIMPSLDFDQEQAFNFNPTNTQKIESTSAFNSKDNGNLNGHLISNKPQLSALEKDNLNNWDNFYQSATHIEGHNQEQVDVQQSLINNDDEGIQDSSVTKPFQIHKKYILQHIKSGIVIIDQNLAHERILFDNFKYKLDQVKPSSQKLLFPLSLELNAADFVLVQGIMNDLKSFGFDIEEFGKNSVIVHGVPPDLKDVNIETLLESILEQIKNNSNIQLGIRDYLALSMAKFAAVKHGMILKEAEMTSLLDELFATESPSFTHTGNTILVNMTLEQLGALFS